MRDRTGWQAAHPAPVVPGPVRAWRALRCLGGRVRRSLRTRRDVLLVAHHQMIAGYLEELRQLFAHDPRLRFWCTTNEIFGDDVERDRVRAVLHAPHYRRRGSRRRWWDLIVFADHNGAEWYAPSIPKLRMQHALVSGKIIEGVEYRYDPRRVLLPDGRPTYDCIFDASEARRRAVEARLPALRGRIEVVGDLRADALLAAATAPRKPATQRLVAIASTWGRGSLVEGDFEGLLAQISQAPADMHFVVGLHSLVPAAAVARLREVESDRVRVLSRADSWTPWLAQADALVSDHTSLAAHFALLQRPIVFGPRPPDVVAPDSTLAELFEACPHYTTSAELLPTLEAALARGASAALRACAPRIHSAPGQSAQRMRASVYRLLRLRPRPPAPDNGVVPHSTADVVLFPSCRAPSEDARAARDKLEARDVEVACVAGLTCCGLPALEQGDLASLRESAHKNLDLLMPRVLNGATVVPLHATCAEMMRMRWPELLDGTDRLRARRLAAAVRDLTKLR